MNEGDKAFIFYLRFIYKEGKDKKAILVGKLTLVRILVICETEFNMLFIWNLMI